jgi:demethylmenaquinone methyltransferase/2-methoxy-6-polyprenyl-1,4-benzoquinol methylase
MRFFQSRDDYAVVAPFFDAALGPFMKPIRREVCRWLHRLNIREVLDICCGTGHQDLMLAETGIRVVGVDRSPSMLEVAQRKGRNRVPFLLSDARRLPFKDNSFDGALISFALHENEPGLWHPMIREAVRVLRPKGSLLVVDYLAPPPGKGRAKTLLIRWVEWMAGEPHYTNFKRFLNSGGLTQILKQHPLRIERVASCLVEMVGLALTTTEKAQGTGFPKDW